MLDQDPEVDDIVITGYGAITPLGDDVDQFYQALLAGKSGVRFLEPVAGIDGEKWMAAVIGEFDPKEHIQPRKIIKVMCREIQLAFAASMQACSMAGIAAGTVEPDRLGTVFSGEIIFSDITDIDSVVRMCCEDGQMQHDRWSAVAFDNIFPLWMLKSLPNMAACHVGIALDARGPNNTITTEGTSGLNATLEAINVIRRGKADVMVVGSTASRTCYTRLLQRYEEEYSRAYDDASTACKPFDERRDGCVPGESASTMVIERRSHALARNAKILGTVHAWANTFAPKPRHWEGIRQATENAIGMLLDRSGISPSQIDHINAGANGTIRMDAGEASAIANLLGDVPVVSYKGGIGDSISGSGLIEWIGSLAGLNAGLIAPTTNHTKTGVDCPINVISQNPKPRNKSYVIKLSHTPQGHCVGLLTST
jgi:3-oxoacyl-[acyl-carrier-protein] synthase II